MVLMDQQGRYCADHPLCGWACFCDEDRDRKLKIHRCSGLDDGLGGYLCICGTGRYSTVYGCMGVGYPEEGDASAPTE